MFPNHHAFSGAKLQCHPRTQLTRQSYSIFFLPNGEIVTVPPNPILSTVAIKQSGTITLIAKASDDHGARDVRLWISTKQCSRDPMTEIESCSAPVESDAPTVSNRDASGPGQKGCTERLVSPNLEVSGTPTGSMSHTLHARGVISAARRFGPHRLNSRCNEIMAHLRKSTKLPDHRQVFLTKQK